MWIFSMKFTLLVLVTLALSNQNSSIADLLTKYEPDIVPIKNSEEVQEPKPSDTQHSESKSNGDGQKCKSLEF